MKYTIIYADPPWKYNNRANHKTRFRGGACGHYLLMPMRDIRTSVYELISSGELPSIKINRSRRILRNDLLAYINRKRQEVGRA